MSEIITESNMNFIADNTFHIEKSAVYTNLGDSIKSVEFVRGKENNLLFVEAKTTFPNPNKPNPENPENFQMQVDDICEKFIHSLNLYSSIKVGVSESALPIDFIVPNKISLMLVLIIKNHDLTWCKPVKLKLEQSLPHYIKQIWKPTIFVINHETAKKYNIAAK